VTLTGAGHSVLEAALPVVEDADAEFFAPVDRAVLMDVLGRLSITSGQAFYED